MLSERQKDSCHPLPAEKSIMDSLVLKTEVQGHVVRGPPSPGPAFLTASSFFSLRSSQVLSWSNMGGSRSYHLPALHSRDVYYCDPLNLGQWHAPTCRCSEEWMRWKPLLGMSNRAFITLIHPFQTPPPPPRSNVYFSFKTRCNYFLFFRWLFSDIWRYSGSVLCAITLQAMLPLF